MTLPFDWDRSNLAHIAGHGVTQAEAEEVLDNGPLDLEVQMVDGEERIVQIGITGAGRVLMVTSTWRENELRVVTAFPASPGFRQLYLREKGRDNVKSRSNVKRRNKDSQV